MSGGDASEKKDPAIKLFGKTIPVPESHISAKLEEKSYVGRHKSEAMDMCSEITKTEAGDVYLEDSGKQSRSSVAKTIKDEDDQIIRDRDGGHANVNPNKEPAETSSVETDKVFKKPDKVLECPRCNSLDTKFCYFNNYNVHQPRHFCKHCQRYWTAGGTMRNVPLGAGRRKNKQLASQYHQLLVSPDAVPTTRIDIPDSTNQQIISRGESRSTLRPLTSSGTVQIFGPEEPLSETVATVHLADQKVYTGDYNSTREKREEPSSCGSSITSSGIQENKIPERVNEQDSLDQSCIDLSWSKSLHHFPVPPWVFPWNQFWNSGASMVEAQSSSELVSAPDNGNPKFQWCSSPMLAFPGFSTPSIPLQFLPISYWNCFPVWTAGTRHAQMVGSDSGGLKSCSANSSPTLGKHSRDATLIVDEKSEKCVLALKRLRSDDSDEASKSSLWATLGFNSN